VIPRDYITEWRAHAPWVADVQVEQDLVICRALVELFSKPLVASALAFRGGTALYKLHLLPAARYSEDIDLVQIEAGAIGPVLKEVRAALDSWLGEPSWKQSEGRVTLNYRFRSEDVPPLAMRLKLEINSREHFTVMGHRTVPLEVASRWFTGRADVPTFTLDELLGTKLRALYQRKKGRDLFDLARALEHADVDRERVVACFSRYMQKQGERVSRAVFEQNLAEKRSDPVFTGDIGPLLAAGAAWDMDRAFESVLRELVALLPGAPWRGGRPKGPPPRSR
jgi:predicted nucleotidyltransferase component of viral defense system